MAETEARRITVRGTVQGVGFRPFVHRLAQRHGVGGWVRNDADGVIIHAEAGREAIDALIASIRREPPPAAVVASLTDVAAPFERSDGFEIRSSATGGAPTTRISPDLCVCPDCLRELRNPADPRHGYLYINCTNCGPRYSIIRSLPYDRPRTTMADWPLCEDCRAEYEDPADRRYHAQPTACPQCGPGYTLLADGAECERGPDAIARAATMLWNGSILAIKGIGGYHLACAATDAAAVGRLRERKFRKEKPFALMASSLESARTLVELSLAHEALLTAVARPIVLAPARVDLACVAPDSSELGVMLPYAPLHHLLFDAGAPDPLVLTSANRSSEPIAYRDDDALDRLAGIADAFLIGQRPIQRRVDDSVVTVRRDTAMMIRRARGYAPASVAALETERPILAVGADLKNAVALATGGEVFVSQHIGDLGELDTDRAFRETVDDLLQMYAVDRRELIVAHDMHPEYVTTRAALELEAARRVPVQHHEAHIASVLLDHRLTSETVIGLALDGTGYGRDGTIWGGELFAGSVAEGFERVGGLEPVSMPGGDAAARFPVQATAAYLHRVNPAVLEREPFLFPRRFREARSLVERGVRCIESTSAGRLFDAAAAVCGFTREISYEGQAAVWLEHIAGRSRCGDVLPGDISLDPRAMVNALCERRRDGVEPGHLAWMFHDTLAAALAAAAIEASARIGTAAVVVSGGVWQNALLTERLAARLLPHVRLILPREIPCNDGGIAAGQIAIAAQALLR